MSYDTSLYENLVQESITAKEERIEGYDEDGVTIAYLNEGSYWLRIYPEVLETESGKKIRLVRKYFRYFFKTIGRFIYQEDGPIEKEINRLEASGFKDYWKYKEQLEGLIKVCLYKINSPKENKYLKLNEPMILALKPKMIYRIEDMLSEMSPDESKELLDPDKKSVSLKLTWGKEDGRWICSIGPTLTKEELPELPEDFPKNLDEIYVTKDSVPKEDDMKKIKKFISNLIASSTDMYEPSSDSTTATDLLSGGDDKETQPEKSKESTLDNMDEMVDALIAEATESSD